MEAPATAGDWYYKPGAQESLAGFGTMAGGTPDFLFTMRCDKTRRIVSLGRVSTQPFAQPMQIRTETMDRLLTASPRTGSVETMLAVDLPATDALLDAMAISKGRFAVEVGGERTLYIPSWPEVTRIIEDCR